MSDEELRKKLDHYCKQGEVDSADVALIENVLDGSDRIQVSASLLEEGETPAEPTKSLDTEEGGDIRKKLADMSLPEKIKVAMYGNSVCRMLLVSDSNRMIQDAVLKNPKLRENEIEEFSKNKSIPEYVLRSIAAHRTWMRSYVLKINLVMNPKTPHDVSLKWLRYLRKSDLQRVAKSKNIPSALATTATKRLADLNRKGGRG